MLDNILEPTINNIIFCVENNIRLRLATIVTPNNLDELENIVEWGHNANVAGMGIGIVHDLGRAQMNNKVLLESNDDWMKFGDILEKMVLKYPGFITEIDLTRQDDANCGSVSSHIVIGSNGETKLCSMDALNKMNSSLGNVIEDGLKEIYVKNQEFILEYGNLKAPRKDSQECSKCINRGFCDGCLYRAFIRGSELVNDCEWYRKVPEVVKSKLIAR